MTRHCLSPPHRRHHGMAAFRDLFRNGLQMQRQGLNIHPGQDQPHRLITLRAHGPKPISVLVVLLPYRPRLHSFPRTPAGSLSPVGLPALRPEPLSLGSCPAA
jgi:hypothetical protein